MVNFCTNAIVSRRPIANACEGSLRVENGDRLAEPVAGDDVSGPTVEAALAALAEFERGAWGQRYSLIVGAWCRAWDRVIPFFMFPPAIRKVIYTTNAIESINAQLRRAVKTQGHFPSDKAATKLLWLVLRNITEAWAAGATHDWKTAMNQFAIIYAERFTDSYR